MNKAEAREIAGYYQGTPIYADEFEAILVRRREGGERIRLLLCPACGQGYTNIEGTAAAHCAGSIVYGTQHPAVDMEEVEVVRCV